MVKSMFAIHALVERCPSFHSFYYANACRWL